LLTQTSLPELQWSQFLETELSCLLETNIQGKNLLAQNPIGIFTSFQSLNQYLEKNPDLLELEDLGFVALKTYDGQEFISLYCEILEIQKPHIEFSNKKIANKIIYPDKKQYFNAIKKCQKHIYEGDIYQANLCHEFQVQVTNSLATDIKELKNFIYSRLRTLNPSQYLALAEFSDWLVFSSSPESFLKIYYKENDFILESSPLKGTAQLKTSLQELKNDKECAEHIMIVDLIRNDLSKIAKKASVKTQNLLTANNKSNLQHLESTISAKLNQENLFCVNATKIPDFAKIFNNICPGGSISGAPKKRALEIINELESTSRELFSGTLGYYKFQKQEGEFNILIRSIFYNKNTGKLSFNTGAGITHASKPEQEYQETLLKAEKLIEVFDAI